MTLIDGDRIITAQLYDDEHEEFIEKKMSIIDYLNAYTDEGVTKADVVEKTRWIPVSERLPEVMDGSNDECSDDVLMCVTDNEHTTISSGFYGYYPKSKSQQGWWSMWAYGCHQLDSKCKVIAWMPLPKPYVPDTNVGDIYECSCGYGWDKNKVVRHHFCPNCGAKMEVEE